MFPDVKPLQLGPKGMWKWKKKINFLYLLCHSSGEQLNLGYPNNHYSSERTEKESKTSSFPLCEPAAVFFSPSCPKNIEILILKVTYLPLFFLHTFPFFTVLGLKINTSTRIFLSLWHISLKNVMPCWISQIFQASLTWILPYTLGFFQCLCEVATVTWAPWLKSHLLYHCVVIFHIFSSS